MRWVWGDPRSIKFLYELGIRQKESLMTQLDPKDPISADKELANQYREEITLALQNVMEILGRARRQGLIINFSLGVDQFGRDFISGNGITVARYL